MNRTPNIGSGSSFQIIVLPNGQKEGDAAKKQNNRACKLLGKKINVQVHGPTLRLSQGSLA